VQTIKREKRKVRPVMIMILLRLLILLKQKQLLENVVNNSSDENESEIIKQTLHECVKSDCFWFFFLKRLFELI
jgi:hypothetical protein